MKRVFVHFLIYITIAFAVLPRCCLGDSENVGLDALLHGIGNIFHMGNEIATSSAPLLSSSMILVNNANSVNTDNDVSSSSTAGNTNTDAASEQQSLPVGQEVAQDGFAAQVATADSDSNDDMEGSTNESKGDNAFTSSKSQVTSVLGSPEIPRSIETIVRTQILVVAPDRIEQMTMSEPQPLRAFESSISASAAALTASASLLSVYNLFALSLAAAAIFITSQWM